MRIATVLIASALLALISTAAYAQQPVVITPDQTPPGPVLQISPDTSSNRLDVEVGAVRLTTRSGRYTFAYLPLLAPLPGTAFRPSIEMPNALALTGTSIPQKPHTYHRAVISTR
jgi:hypothetical protein